MLLDTTPRLNTLTRQLADALLARGWFVTAAESCTGGGVAYAFTSLPGSSRWFETGFVTYSNPSKSRLLEVPADTLTRHGAVSEPVVRAMVTGALARSGAQVGVAISGVAGPGGGTVPKPAGTVWFAWGLSNGEVRAERQWFRGDRESVRRQSVEHAIAGLVALMSEKPV